MDDTIPQKRCTGPCERMLPATPDFFHRQKDSLRSRCKDCTNTLEKNSEAYKQRLERRKSEYWVNPEIRESNRVKSREYYRRPEVHERLIAYGHVRNSRPERRAYQTAYNETYRQRPGFQDYMRTYMRNYRRRPYKEQAYRQSPKTRLSQKLYRSRPEYQEHARSYQTVYFSRPEKRDRRHIRDRANSHNRRARKKAVPGTYTPAQIQDLLKRQRYRCYYCTTKLKRDKSNYVYHVDHTFPLSRVAGTGIPANDISYLVLTCPTCNMRKGDKFPHEWPEGGKLL